MKPQHILLFLLIAIGAITGSTLATIAYLNNRKSAPVLPEELSQSKDNSLNASLNLKKQATAEERGNSKNNNFQLRKQRFSEFRQSFLDAVKRRDEVFIRALVSPEKRSISDRTIDLDSYNLDDPNSPFWQKVEKAVDAGCTIEPNVKVSEQESGDDVWVCPNTSGKPIYSSDWQDRVAILGERVNVRTEPETSGSVVGVLSKELAKFDSETFNKLPNNLQESVNTPDGWTPIVLKNGKKGWVQNRFIYYGARDYRVSFIRYNGEWRLRYLLQGEGN